ncbi:MAG: hypothetical protein IH628_05155 [Proteobacteria bacterium]|nr:hypothetical protein [Pseudomonadota bacterium]
MIKAAGRRIMPLEGLLCLSNTRYFLDIDFHGQILSLQIPSFFSAVTRQDFQISDIVRFEKRTVHPHDGDLFQSKPRAIATCGSVRAMRGGKSPGNWKLQEVFRQRSADHGQTYLTQGNYRRKISDPPFSCPKSPAAVRKLGLPGRWRHVLRQIKKSKHGASSATHSGPEVFS